MQKFVVISLAIVVMSISLIVSSEDAYAFQWLKRVTSTDSPGCNTDALDSDRDGICDSWEQGAAGLVADWPAGSSWTLPCTYSDTTKCPSTDKRDIFVEIDYMDGHQPDQAAIDQVIAAFDAKGIRLHVYVDEKALAHASTTRFPGFNLQTAWGFDQVKQCHFGTEAERGSSSCTWTNPDNRLSKRAAFHYGLFVHAQAAQPTSSGIAEIFGNDFMISLGSFTGGVGNTDEQAGTLMHELGHNLRLNHGGGEFMSDNCKPNHISVMDYNYQFSNFVSDRKLDYSFAALGPSQGVTELVENGVLDEPLGLTQYDDRRYVWGPTPPITLPTAGRDQADWNLDGAYNYGQIANINSLPGCGSTTSDDIMPGYDDWSNIDLRFDLSGSSYSDGASSSDPREVTGEVSTKGATSEDIASFDEVTSDITTENVDDQRVLRITALECFLDHEICPEEGESEIQMTPVVLRQEFTDSDELKPADKDVAVKNESEEERYNKPITKMDEKVMFVSKDPKEIMKTKKDIVEMTTEIKKSLMKHTKTGENLKDAISQIKELQASLDGKLNPDTYKVFLEGTDDIIKSYEIAADYKPTNVHSLKKIPSPLKQIKDGVNASDVKCREGLELVFNSRNAPACIYPHTAETLRSWGVLTK